MKITMVTLLVFLNIGKDIERKLGFVSRGAHGEFARQVEFALLEEYACEPIQQEVGLMSHTPLIISLLLWEIFFLFVMVQATYSLCEN